MKSKALFLLVALLGALALVMTGCAPKYSFSTDGGVKTGNLLVKITDAPNPLIESVDVTFTGVKIHAAGSADENEDEELETLGNNNEDQNDDDDEDNDDQDEESVNNSMSSGKGQDKGQKPDKGPKEPGAQSQNQDDDNGSSAENSNGNGSWITLDMADNDDVTFNLLDYQDGLEKLLAIGDDLPAGKYTQIRLEVSAVWITFPDDSDKDPVKAKLPSDTLKFVHPFEIVEGETTELVFDWDAEKSLVFTGNGQIICKPVIKLVTKIEDDNDDEDETLEITSPTNLEYGILDEKYKVDLAARGGDKPYTWSLDGDDTLPKGLELDEDGKISGIPEEAGSFTFIVKVVDSSVPELSGTAELTIEIEPAEDD